MHFVFKKSDQSISRTICHLVFGGSFPFGPAKARDSSGPVLIGRLIRSLILALFKQISTDRDMSTLYDIAENSP